MCPQVCAHVSVCAHIIVSVHEGLSIDVCQCVCMRGHHPHFLPGSSQSCPSASHGRSPPPRPDLLSEIRSCSPRLDRQEVG